MPRLVIREMLRKKNVSQYRLAIEMRINPKNTARLLKPGANLTFDTLCRIAKALKCRVRDLIKE